MEFSRFFTTQLSFMVFTSFQKLFHRGVVGNIHGEIHFLDYANEGQNFLGKGNNQTTEETKEALRTLACIMALD